MVSQERNEAWCRVRKTPRSKSNLDARSYKVAHCGFKSLPDYKKLKVMELILYGIIGSLIGCLIVLITINLFKSKPSIDYQELIKQSEERLDRSKKYGEELDRMLEEMKN